MTLADLTASAPAADTGHDSHHAAGDWRRMDRTELSILVTVLFVVIGWGLSIATWGVPGLYIPALAMVPVMYVLLIWISRG